MTPEEAYNVLEVNSTISDDDLKKKHKELSFKHHPDRGGDVDKLKKINESYQFIKDFREHPEKHQPQQAGFWGNISDIFNQGFFQQREQNLNAQPIQINLHLTFHEAVLGCSKEISYDHHIKCASCNGEGGKHLKNDCQNCDGFGRSTKRNGDFIVQMSCEKCHGKGTKQEKCQKCNGKRTTKAKNTGSINIPAGVSHNSVLNISGHGNFISSGLFGDEYSPVLVQLQVQEHKTMKMDGNNILSTLNLSLLEALTGCEKEVETINGNKSISIPPKSKNKESINIPDAGVKGTSGKHIVNLNISYPEDISKLLEILNAENN